MVAFPIVTAVVLGVLTLIVYQQWHTRGRPQQLAWAVSLACGCIGTLAYVGVVFGLAPALLFRVYYMGGAVLIAPLLGVGSAYLLPSRLWARLLLAVTAASGAMALTGLAAPLNASALAHLGMGPGTTVVTAPAVIVAVVVANSLGTIAVVGVAVYSAWRARRLGWTVVGGNGLIAAGTFLVAAAGSMARLGHGAGFWGTMTGGWLVLYAGFALLAAFRPAGASTAATRPA